MDRTAYKITVFEGGKVLLTFAAALENDNLEFQAKDVCGATYDASVMTPMNGGVDIAFPGNERGYRIMLETI